MARKAPWPPPIRAHKASGQDRVYWQGQYYYLGRSGTAEVRQRYLALLQRLADTREQDESTNQGLAMAELVSAWLAWAEGPDGPTPEERSEHLRALQIALALFAALPAAQFRARHLGEVRAHMVRLGWCRRVILRRTSRIRNVFRWAEARELVPAGSWAHLRSLEPLSPRAARAHPPRQPSALKDVEKVASCCVPTVGAMLLFGWHTGCRPGEMRLLRVGQIDRTGEVWMAHPGAHKNSWRGQGRAVAIGPRAQEVLAPWLEGKRSEDWVFPSRTGQPYIMRSVCQAVRRASRKAQVALVTYQGRHAYKQRVTRAMSLDAARAALGQISLQATNQYASGADEQIARDAAKLLG